MSDPNQSQDKSPSQQAAEAMKSMAANIEKNQAADFGGAFVVVDPAGNIISTLVLDSRRDLGMFWGLLKTQADMKINDIQTGASITPSVHNTHQAWRGRS